MILKLVFVPIIATAFWYLGALATITQRPRQLIADRSSWFTALLQCAACSGTWYGAGLALWAQPFGDRGWDLFEGCVSLGLVCQITTPLLGALLVLSLAEIAGIMNAPE